MFKPNINYRIGSPGHMYSRILEAKNQDSVDILILGSSHTYRGFDTRIFSKHGYKTFNFGSSSQTPIQTKVLIERYLHRLNPKTVLYEVYPVAFTLDGVESSLDIIANDENDMHSLNMALEINNVKTYNTLLYGYIRDFLDLNESFVEENIKGVDTYVSGGFVERKVSYFRPSLIQNQKIEIYDKQLEAFGSIIKTLKKRGVDVILVYAPIPKVSYNSYTNQEYFDSLMTTYSDYINFNETISLNDSIHFYDSDHMNQNGVNVFNEKLIETLKSNFSDRGL